MAHFAKLDENNVVLRVSVIDNSNTLDGDGNESESVGVAYINSIHPHEAGQFTWKQTSYNNNFRGNYAGIGMVYMEGVATLGVASTDVFMPPKVSCLILDSEFNHAYMGSTHSKTRSHTRNVRQLRTLELG